MCKMNCIVTVHDDFSLRFQVINPRETGVYGKKKACFFSVECRDRRELKIPFS
jgi:hypothetical protein